MTDARSAWSEAGERLTALGASLKSQYEKQKETEAEEPRKEVNDALRRLGEAVQDTFEAVGAAVRDPSVKEEAKKVGTSLSGALSATFADVSEEVKSAFTQRKGDAAAAPGAGGPEAAAPEYGTPPVPPKLPVPPIVDEPPFPGATGTTTTEPPAGPTTDGPPRA